MKRAKTKRATAVRPAIVQNPAKKRRRRDPAEARLHILEAAKRVLARVGPDAGGLQAIAREAGVSHGLLNHYFGSYDALVEATLEENSLAAQRKILARLVDAGPSSPGELIDVFFDLLEEPLHGRLLAWAMLTGRTARDDFFARRVRGPKQVVDAIVARLEQLGAPVDRETIERLVVLVMSAGFGYALSRGVLWEALGHPATDERRLAFRAWLAELVQRELAARMAPLP